MWLMIKGNGLKRKSEKKRKEVEVVDKIIHVPNSEFLLLLLFLIHVLIFCINYGLRIFLSFLCGEKILKLYRNSICLNSENTKSG